MSINKRVYFSDVNTFLFDPPTQHAYDIVRMHVMESSYRGAPQMHEQ